MLFDHNMEARKLKYRMPFYKVIATVSFEFETDLDQAQALEKSKRLVGEVVDSNPQGDDYQDFGVQVELVPLKDRHSTITRLRTFTPEQVFHWVDQGSDRRHIEIGGKVYEVKMNSDRYRLFKSHRCCAACGLEGKKFVLECQTGSDCAHFNFYGQEDGRDVLMTKDHIQAKAYGGADSMNNYATLCAPCNQAKASYPISYEAVRTLREMLRNKDHLPAKVLKNKVAEARLLMLDYLNGQ